MSDHTMVVTLEPGGGTSFKLTCQAPLRSQCHAYWDCDCEAAAGYRVEHGVPVHDSPYDDGDVEHVGRFRESYCNYCEWMNDSDCTGELLDGKEVVINIPAVVTWSSGHSEYTWRDARTAREEGECPR